jgi:hypothetical protein
MAAAVFLSAASQRHGVLLRTEFHAVNDCTGDRRENVAPVGQCRRVVDRATSTSQWVRTECSLDGLSVSTVAYTGVGAATCSGDIAPFSGAATIAQCKAELDTSSIFEGSCATTANAPLYSFRAYATTDGSCDGFASAFPHFDDEYDAPFQQLGACRAFVAANETIGGVTFGGLASPNPAVRSYKLSANDPGSVTLAVFAGDSCLGTLLRSLTGVPQGSDVTARTCTAAESTAGDRTAVDAEIYLLVPGGGAPSAPPTYVPPAPAPAPDAGLIAGISALYALSALFCVVAIAGAALTAAVVVFVARQRRRAGRGVVGRSDLFEPLGAEQLDDDDVFPVLALPPDEDPWFTTPPPSLLAPR